MKKSASQIASENINILKQLTAAEIEERFSKIFSNSLSRNNFIKALRQYGINFDRMNFIEKSIEFTVIDKYSNGPAYLERIHSSFLNEKDINNMFYPFCTEVYAAKKEIHIIPCEYNHNGYQITPNVAFK